VPDLEEEEDFLPDERLELEDFTLPVCPDLE
jgi:hypothetical protein